MNRVIRLLHSGVRICFVRWEVLEMPRWNRSEICAEDENQAFHLINRCVRRTYLCRKDRRIGKEYSHRKEWIRARLEELAGIFGLDVLGFAVLCNHLHVVVRTRPDVVRAWSDDEVAVRLDMTHIFLI